MANVAMKKVVAGNQLEKAFRIWRAYDKLDFEMEYFKETGVNEKWQSY